MSRYNRCNECYNMECIFVTGERTDIDTSECADFRPMTNADRIRGMTDEELATNFAGRCCPKKDEFYDCGKLNGKSFSWEDCRKCWLDWLKSPVEVDNG